MATMQTTLGFPRQQLSFRSKGTKWRKSVLDWADSRTFIHYSPTRQSVRHKKISYDLLDGKLHMDDLADILNPDGTDASFVPDDVRHYPIMNSKVNLLLGEELARGFEYSVVLTNPNAIAEAGKEKMSAFMADLQESIEAASKEQNPENAQRGLMDDADRLQEYYANTWQDMRERRANYLLGHYSKEQNFRRIFNDGFRDAIAVGEEIYRCDIVCGEPVIERLNPLRVRAFKGGYSSRFEDADIIILEDYWAPGRIIDTYHDALSVADMRYLETLPDTLGSAGVDPMGNIHDLGAFIPVSQLNPELFGEGSYGEAPDGFDSSLLPFDMAGNVRVMHVYWRSRRKILRIKRYDPETGDPDYVLMPEDYILDTAAGEESETLWINEAWEGTKIGADIYVDMRPCRVQFNRMTDPSRCHFGIVGSIYGMNGARPYSLVDVMKPYSYLYDVIHDRLNRLIARSWGNMVSFDLASIPKGWDVDKLLYYARTQGMLVRDSFKEGNVGASTGKLAGTMNGSAPAAIPTSDLSAIQHYMNLLTWIKEEMSDACGVSRQREGQVFNRETVGGVERATLQSSHITEWMFAIHDDVRKRALECFLEVAKAALRGKEKRFEYIVGGDMLQMVDIDGDEFAENDYGIVVDNNGASETLKQQVTALAQAALQNQALTFSTILKLYSSCSLSEKMKIVKAEENKRKREQQQAQQQQAQQQQQAMQAQQQQAQQEAQLKQEQHRAELENEVLIARIKAGMEIPNVTDAEDNAELQEQKRQFDEKARLEREKIAATQASYRQVRKN